MATRLRKTGERNNKEAVIIKFFAVLLSTLLITGCFPLMGCQGALNNSEGSPPPVEEKKELTVYITRTGECYHRTGCQYLRQSCIPVDLDDAKDYYRP